MVLLQQAINVDLHGNRTTIEGALLKIYFNRKLGHYTHYIQLCVRPLLALSYCTCLIFRSLAYLITCVY